MVREGAQVSRGRVGLAGPPAWTPICTWDRRLHPGTHTLGRAHRGQGPGSHHKSDLGCFFGFDFGCFFFLGRTLGIWKFPRQ